MINLLRPTPPGVTAGPAKPWVPGDPLWNRNDHQHSRGLYGFRDDNTAETCSCSDAADWPAQVRRPIAPIGGDELGDFIAAVKADRGDAA